MGFADQFPVEGCFAQTPAYSVMNVPCSEGDAFPPPNGFMATSFSVCDRNTIQNILYPPSCNICPQHQGSGTTNAPIIDKCNPECGPCPASPVVVDIRGDGVEFTSALNGVYFDIVPRDGYRELVAWTRPGSDDAWLCLDRNRNGVIDDGLELFGNYTEQPPSESPNGFVALAEFDRLQLGGNEDGRISRTDAIWTDLRLWQDLNHDGISSIGELRTPEEVGVIGFDLAYKKAKVTDRFGNTILFRAKVFREEGTSVGRYAYDVFLSFD